MAVRWNPYDLCGLTAWSTGDLNTLVWIWVVDRNGGWCVETSDSHVALAGPFETKEAAMLAAELMFG